MITATGDQNTLYYLSPDGTFNYINIDNLNGRHVIDQ